MTAVRTQWEVPSCEALLAGVARAWNDGNGLTFASYFAEDAELVNVHGMRVRGRQAIAGLYEMLFRSVFADASMEFDVSRRRELCAGSTMLHMRLEIRVPRGHLAGEHQAQSTMVLQYEGRAWAIASLQSTLVTGPLG